MNLTDDETLKFLRGTPILLDDICAIYPSKMGEIVDIGYSKFQQYLELLTLTTPLTQHLQDKELNEMLSKMSSFQYILLLASCDSQIHILLKEAFLFFTHENVIFSLEPAQIIIGPSSEKHIMNEEKFYDFQKILRRMCFIEQEGEEITINPDDSPTVVALKKKMLLNREKVRKAKAKKAAQEKNDLKFSDLIASITINNCGLNMENIWNITYYAVHDQLKRMGWRDQFDINNRAALAGAKLKKNQLKHWMRSIASSDKS